MTIRQVGLGMLVLAVLVGCTAAPQPLPPGLTDDEVAAIRAAEQQSWWDQIAPGEPMPVIEVVRYVDNNDTATRVECLKAQPIPGVTVTPDNGFMSNGLESQKALDRAFFVCAQMYPPQGSTDDLGLYSSEQLSYLYDDFTERLLPCLRMMGFRIADPSPQFFGQSGYLPWDPYAVLVRNPAAWDASLWALVDVRCPPPAIGQFWRVGEDS